MKDDLFKISYRYDEQRLYTMKRTGGACFNGTVNVRAVDEDAARSKFLEDNAACVVTGVELILPKPPLTCAVGTQCPNIVTGFRWNGSQPVPSCENHLD